MIKKSNLVFIIALCFIISGCSETEIYPKINITANGVRIEYSILSDKTSAYVYAFEQNPEMENLAALNNGDTVTIDFMGDEPDKITVAYELLTVPYFDFSLNDNTKSMVKET